MINDPNMIHRKIIILLVSFPFLFMEVIAQPSRIDSLPATAGYAHGYSPLPLHQLHVGIQAGTEFMTTSGNGSGLSTFLSPTLTYPVSKKFIVSGGISVVNTSLYGFKPYYSFPEEKSYSGNITQARLWVSGQYLLNDRVTITGTAYKTIDIFGEKPGNSSFYRNNPQGAFLNVGYKISDNIHIEAGFGYSKGLNGYSCGYPGIHGFGSSNYNPFFNR
jgi:hypothetical protein